jgi:phage terminase small subunit
MGVLPLKSKTQTASKPPPPRHLSKKMKAFWRSAFERRRIQPYKVEILLKACEAHDRSEQARRILKKEGLTYLDRFLAPRSRPEVAIERDSRSQFAKLLDQVGLWDPYFKEED